jgi:SAM-dependent methyltransferase
MRWNKESWRRKPLLRAIYGRFYELVRRNLAPVPGSIVELGSGIGAIKEYIPNCITTDIFANPWIDRIENAYALKFDVGTVSNLILVDVFHHLKFPGTALQEFLRVVVDEGRVILLEPGMGALGKFIYARFHHEALGLRKPISWCAPAGFNPHRAGYYAAQGNASRIFLKREFLVELRPWRVIHALQLPEFAYVASGGYSKPQLYPEFMLPWIRMVERVFSRWPDLSATRLLVVLEKRKQGSCERVRDL